MGYHAQQCAEKYLKALLVSKFIDFPYTYSIEVLVKLSPAEFGLSNKLERVFELTNYAIARRYPGFMVIYPSDAEQAVILAELTKHVINPSLS